MRYGKVFGQEEKRVLIGTSAYAGSRVLERLLEQPGRAEPLGHELLELVERRLLEDATAFPGAEQLVVELKDRLPIAVASNTPQRLVRGALACAGLEQYFGVIVTADEVAEPKPSPDIYLLACERLGVPPSRSIALEDSPTGVAAARAAGMFVIGIPSFPGVLLHEADLVGASLTDVRVRAALGLN
jgi:HAD superfamily hydrolase (TIGR01509 family)